MTASFEEAIANLSSWVGRRRAVDDEIGLGTVRRIAAMLDLDPDAFEPGAELPPHWFSMFFADVARQSDIGPDGHPDKGVFLPPIPLPRRMGAGRRVRIHGRLRVAQAARKVAEVAAIVPKRGRTGPICILTMRHTIETGGAVVAVDEFRHLPRGGAPGKQECDDTADARAARRGVVRAGDPHRTARVPLLGDHLERASHPLRRRLRARGGGLSEHGAKRRSDHAAHARRRAEARPRRAHRIHLAPDAPHLRGRHDLAVRRRGG